jgi:hypothetical protein
MHPIRVNACNAQTWQVEQWMRSWIVVQEPIFVREGLVWPLTFVKTKISPTTRVPCDRVRGTPRARAAAGMVAEVECVPIVVQVAPHNPDDPAETPSEVSAGPLVVNSARCDVCIPPPKCILNGPQPVSQCPQTPAYHPPHKRHAFLC